MIDNTFPQSLTSSVAQEFQPIYDISFVIPTRNEAGNIEPLLMRIHQAVKGLATEVVFVDDSTDDTPAVIRKLQEWFPLPIKLIHCPQVERQNGVGGAMIEGFKAAQAKWMCVMDAEWRHLPEMLPQLYRHAQKSRADIVIGSRLSPAGGASRPGFTRTLVSSVFARTTDLAFPQRQHKVTDPLTGFFMTRRAALNPEELRLDRFPILMEILMAHPHLKVAEVPIEFDHQPVNESKASIDLLAKLISLFAITFLRYLLSDKWFWKEKNGQGTALREEERKAPMNAKIGAFDYSYNIHNIIKLASMYELPELEYFRVPALTAEPDILIRLERRRKKDRRRTERSAGTPRRSREDIHYGETLGRYGFEISISNRDRINIAVSPILRFSRHVLYTNVVEPILRWCFVRKGYALVHAACISFDGQAILVTAPTDTGKTATVLRTVDNYACSFLSDDMTIVSRDGR
ncbi:MAG TPA: glycosyltransferase, partial [Anaerolineales bacterium]|nr:glycosyltransferase [Anaerolineales bacterium]